MVIIIAANPYLTSISRVVFITVGCKYSFVSSKNNRLEKRYLCNLKSLYVSYNIYVY